MSTSFRKEPWQKIVSTILEEWKKAKKGRTFLLDEPKSISEGFVIAFSIGIEEKRDQAELILKFSKKGIDMQDALTNQYGIRGFDYFVKITSKEEERREMEMYKDAFRKANTKNSMEILFLFILLLIIGYGIYVFY